MTNWHPVSWIAIIISVTICIVALLMALEVVYNNGNEAAHKTLDSALEGMSYLIAMFFGTMVKALAEKMTKDEKNANREIRN